MQARQAFSVQVARRVIQLLSRAATNSDIRALNTAVERRISSVATRSKIYRWVTSEPEPDTIVIDLGRSATVGPLARVLYFSAGRLNRSWSHSRSQSLLKRANRIVSNSQVGRLVAAAIAPPETVGANDIE